MVIPPEYTRVSLESVRPGDTVYVRAAPGAEATGPMIVEEELDGSLRAVAGPDQVELDGPDVEIYSAREPDPEAAPPRIEWDDATRTVRTIDPVTGAVISTRPYDASENANADAAAKAAADAAAEQAIRDALSAALTDLQAILDDTNANINSNPALRIKTLARSIRRVIRLQIRKLDGTA